MVPAHRPRADQVSYAEYRQDPEAYGIPASAVGAPFTEVGATTVHRVPVTEPGGEIEVEVYRPTQAAIDAGGLQKAGRLPLVIDFHGGGFVLGGLEADASLCRQICQSVGCVVANVAYRLAPDFPHPVPVTDSYAALKWAITNADTLGVDPERIAVCGLSAGACLAAVLAVAARDDRDIPPLALQVLIVPLVDARYIPVLGRPDPAKVPYESYISCEFAPMLPVARLVWFYNLWLGTGDDRAERAADYRASPITAASLAGLAPATLHVAEIDPLRSEAEAYHAALEAAGTESKIKVYEAVGHPFGHWDGQLDKGKELLRDIAHALRRAFAIRY